MKEQLDTYSTREKNLWFEFLTDLAVALYYWPNAIRLMMFGDEALRGGAMIGLITSTVVIAIVVSGALSIFLHTQQKPEPMDERDYMIAARSSLYAGRVLVACLIVVIGMLVIEEIPGPYTSHFEFFQLSPLVLAHLLLVSLMLWSMTSSIARLFFYRRGY
jgi:hypothetical protein